MMYTRFHVWFFVLLAIVLAGCTASSVTTNPEVSTEWPTHLPSSVTPVSTLTITTAPETAMVESTNTPAPPPPTKTPTVTKIPSATATSTPEKAPDRVVRVKGLKLRYDSKNGQWVYLDSDGRCVAHFVYDGNGSKIEIDIDKIDISAHPELVNLFAAVNGSILYRRYSFIQSCPVQSNLCLDAQTIRYPRVKAVGLTLKKNQPFYAIADGILDHAVVGSGKHMAYAYNLELKNGIEIQYTFPVDTKRIIPEGMDRWPNGRHLGTKVRAGQEIGFMGKKELEKRFYHGFNLVISMDKPGKKYTFLDLEGKDLWGLRTNP